CKLCFLYSFVYILLNVFRASSEKHDYSFCFTVASLNLDPAHDVAKIEANVSVSTVRRVLASIALKHKHPVNATQPEVGDAGKLCNSGFYNPSMGSYCHYPNNKKENISSTFQILVNEDNFEIAVWKEGYYGSVPQKSVRTCSSEEMYVGKNKYGLGKVDPKDQCFYLPWEGSEYWYRSYEVLTCMTAEEDLISDVSYVIDKSCDTVSLTKTTTDERRWDISSSITFGVTTTIKTGIPAIVSGNIEISAETTHTFSGGNTWTEQVSHSVSIQLTVPPNHSCTVKMVGYPYKMEIPFTARLNRTYEDRETRSVNISGTYHGVQVGEIRAEVERCQPVSNSEHSSEKLLKHS
uniref:Natterin-3 n=1 Tax=Poecilia reticulata TaxID=8081 RepID=A0A3P9PA34_POERE